MHEQRRSFLNYVYTFFYALALVVTHPPYSRGAVSHEPPLCCAAGQAALLRALEKGWLRHFVGDVFAQEPLSPGSPLWGHPGVTVTPHNAAVSRPADVAKAFEGNLARYLEGGAEALRNVFHWEAGY